MSLSNLDNAQIKPEIKEGEMNKLEKDIPCSSTEPKGYHVV